MPPTVVRSTAALVVIFSLHAGCSDAQRLDCDSIDRQAEQSVWIREERDKIRQVLREMQSIVNRGERVSGDAGRVESLKRQLREIAPGAVIATTDGRSVVDERKAEEGGRDGTAPFRNWLMI